VSAPGPAITITVVNKPIITSPAEGIITKENQPTFSGTSDASDGSYFEIATTMPISTTLCSGTVINQTWNCTSAVTLTDGYHEYRLESKFGATSVYSIDHSITIDTVLPAAPTVNPPINPVNSSPGPTISGTGEQDASIEVFVDSVAVPCPGSDVDGSGNWSCTIGTTLSAGPHTVTVFQTDVAGNRSLVSGGQPLIITDNTPPSPPVVTAPIGVNSGGFNVVTTNDTTPLMTGTGEPGAQLNLFGNTCMIWPTFVDPSGNWTCQLTTPMSPDGDYDLPLSQTDLAANSSPFASPGLRFSVDTVAPDTPDVLTPTGPVVSGVIQATTSNPHPVITGTAEYGATVQIVRAGSIPVPCVGGTPIGDAGGGFTCTVATTLSPGVHTFRFAQTDPAGNSSGPPVLKLRLNVTAPPPPPAPALPAPPPSWVLQFSSSSDNPQPGDRVTLSGANLPPGSTVDAELHSTPVRLGTSSVLDDGTFALTTVIPTTVQPGAHHFVVTVTPITGSSQTAELPVTVVVAPPPAIPERAAPGNPTNSTGGQATSESGSIGADPIMFRNSPTAPNLLSHALPTLQDILANPLILAAAAASSLALLFLVAFPAELLNSTLDANYARIFGKLPRLRLPWLTRLRDRLKRTPVLGGLAMTTLAALILSFADPHFGFDLASLRLFLACGIGMFVLGFVANAVTGFIIQRRWNIVSVIELKPFGLFVALAGVILSRVLDFAPGLLIGLVLGLSLSASATVKEEVRAVLVWVAVILGLAVASWLVYSFVSSARHPSTFADALFDDSIVAIATEGISGLVIGLLPLGFLDGRIVFRHSRRLWLGTYTAALISFFVIVVPSGALWGDIDGTFWIWLTVLLVFAALCIGIYLWFQTHPESEESGGDHGEPSDEISVQANDTSPSR
jgi:hypothetical protein